MKSYDRLDSEEDSIEYKLTNKKQKNRAKLGKTIRLDTGKLIIDMEE